jgi:serine/threonine-protein kinase HipA
MRQLDVYVNERKAGVLTEQRPGEGYSFRYDEAYLTSGSPSISVTLSKKQESYESPTLFPFS